MVIGVSFFLWSAVLLFAGGAFCGGLSLRRRRRVGFGGKAGIFAGWIFLGAGLFLRGVETGSCPLGNGFEVGVFVVWAGVLVYLLTGGFSGWGDTAAGGLAAACLVFVLCVFDSTGARGAGAGWVSFHAGLALLGYGVFGVLGLGAVLYLGQVASLRRHGSAGDKLPSLRVLDGVLLRLLATGVVVLGVGISAGFFAWFRSEGGGVGGGKLAAGCLVFFVWAGVLFFRLRERLLSVRFAWICVTLPLLSLLALLLLQGGGK